MTGVTEGELPDLAEDVVYELDMLDYATAELRRIRPELHTTTASTTTTTISMGTGAVLRAAPSKPDRRTQSAMVELLLLHARILRELLRRSPDFRRRCLRRALRRRLAPSVRSGP